MRKLIKNAIRCKLCGDVIESRAIHDFVWCSCRACYVDGGLDYQRIGGDRENWEDLSEYDDVPGYIVTYETTFGSKNTFATTRPINEVIAAYEDMWAKVEVKDEDGNVIYKTDEVDKREERV